MFFSVSSEKEITSFLWPPRVEDFWTLPLLLLLRPFLCGPVPFLKLSLNNRPGAWWANQRLTSAPAVSRLLMNCSSMYTRIFKIFNASLRSYNPTFCRTFFSAPKFCVEKVVFLFHPPSSTKLSVHFSLFFLFSLSPKSNFRRKKWTKFFGKEKKNCL